LNQELLDNAKSLSFVAARIQCDKKWDQMPHLFGCNLKVLLDSYSRKANTEINLSESVQKNISQLYQKSLDERKKKLEEVRAEHQTLGVSSQKAIVTRKYRNHQ
jgi:hypothetical protein